MNIDILKQELKKIGTDLHRGTAPLHFVNRNPKMFIDNANGKWQVFTRKFEQGKLLDDKIDLKEYATENEACADFLQREKDYQHKKITEYKQKFTDKPIEIIVATGSLGFGGGGVVRDLFAFSMEIIGWCGSDNKINRSKAKIERLMTSQERTEFQKQIAVDGIYKIKVRQRKENVGDTTYFYVDEVIGKVNHAELQKILDKELMPITLKDEQIGEIVWSRKHKNFDVDFNAWGGKWRLGIRIDKNLDLLKGHLPTIKRHIAWIQNKKDNFMKEIVTDEAVKMANEWRPCPTGGKPYFEMNGKKIESEITKTIFIDSFKNCDLGLSIKDGKYNYHMFFNPTNPDLFAGHSLEVYCIADKDEIGDKYFIKVQGLAG